VLLKKKIVAGALVAALGCGFFGACDTADAATRQEIAAVQVKKATDFRYWSRNAPAKKELIAYVTDVTDKNSKNYIPPEDRIAVFDCDGTLMCETAPYYFDWMLCLHRIQEDKNFHPTEHEKEFAQKTARLDSEKNNRIFPEIFFGLTPEQYQDYVTQYMNTSFVEGLSVMKTGEAFYLPMVEVVSYLANNGFEVYIVSGCERDTLRALVKGIMPIPPERIIGSDHSYRMKRQPDEVRADIYQYTKDDKLVRGMRPVDLNIKSEKVVKIQREIGKKPVLAFGNSDGDASMLDYTITGNKYKARGFVLLCDDTDRELGNIAKADKMKTAALEHGWIAVSMKDDFKTIYGDKMKRTKAKSVKE